MSEIIEKAKALAEKYHERQLRHMDEGREEIPYSTHPIGVADMVAQMTKDEELIVVAYLHDAIEDLNKENHNNYTIEDLESDLNSLGPNILDYARALSHNKDKEDYRAYIERISKDEKLRIIKICDMIYNVTESPNENQKKKYREGLKILFRGLVKKELEDEGDGSIEKWYEEEFERIHKEIIDNNGEISYEIFLKIRNFKLSNNCLDKRGVVKKTIKDSLNKLKTKEKIEGIIKLYGVRIPIASAILAMKSPDEFAIIDINVLTALDNSGEEIDELGGELKGKKKEGGWESMYHDDAEFYVRYNTLMTRLHEKTNKNMNLRDFEFKLFIFGKKIKSCNNGIDNKITEKKKREKKKREKEKELAMALDELKKFLQNGK